MHIKGESCVGVSGGHDDDILLLDIQFPCYLYNFCWRRRLYNSPTLPFFSVVSDTEDRLPFFVASLPSFMYVLLSFHDQCFVT
jgi:hypothetical protein